MMKVKYIFLKFLIKLGFYKPIFYINGAETLPPPLDSYEERELLLKKDEDAINKLIVHNLRLVVYIAKKFDVTTNINIEDLVSIGTIGLIKAVNTFCIEKNIKLATYASRCIENEISIDEPLNTDWDGNELLLSDILGSESDEICRAIEQEDERCIIIRFVDQLPPREKQIMQMRFGMNGYNEYTQKDVADCLGISQSYISRLEKRIIGKLKKQIEKVV